MLDPSQLGSQIMYLIWIYFAIVVLICRFIILTVQSFVWRYIDMYVCIIIYPQKEELFVYLI